ESVLRGLACTSGPGLLDAADRSGLSACYDVTGPMAAVPELMGGTIPADVWPYYLGGLGALVTVCDTPHYHTALDLPDTLSGQHLAGVAEASAACLRLLSSVSVELLAGRDVPRGALSAGRVDGALQLEATFAWEDGQRVPVAPVEFLAFRD